MDHPRLLDDILTWASADANVRLVVLTGSLAREEGAADQLSDLDIELYVRHPQLLLDRGDWYDRFGQVLVVEELENPDWNPTRLIYYVDGKIDFMIAGVDAAKRGVEYDRPYRVLVDKDGLGNRLHAVSLPARPPSSDEFSTCINWFYAAALMCAKGIVRGEPWMAKGREWDLKTQLLQMIEWDHKSRYGWNFDTWQLGRHMREWMDADIIERLRRCWADFSPENMTSALSASVDLFADLSARTANKLGLAWFDSDAVHHEIARLLSLGDERV
jgi:aminoglycoside 6-adenylyltransferase